MGEQTPLAAAWRFRWLVLLLTLLGGAGALLYALGTQTTRYSATASLVVTDPRATTLFGAADVVRRDPRRYVADQVAILESDSVIQRAVELAMTENPNLSIDAFAIAAGVRIFSGDSNEIQVQYVAEDQATPVAAVNAVILAYSEVRRSEALRDSASAVEQLDGSIAKLDDELQGIAQQIIDVRNDPVRAELERQFQEALGRLAELQPGLATATGEELTDLRAELRDLTNQFNTLAGIIGIEKEGPRLVQLFREQAQAVDRRGNLAEERDRLLVDTELLSGGISLSSPAQFAHRIKSDVVTTTVLGAILGLLAGGGLAYLLADRRRRFSERTQPGWILRADLLAEVPNFKEEGIKSERPVFDYPYSASAETFRFAATSLDLQTETDPEAGDTTGSGHTFLVTSATLRNGKTVSVANVGLAAAQKGRRVLVVDADFGHQQLTQILRGTAEARVGITEVVETGLDLDDAVFSLDPPGTLDLLSRGSRPTTAPDFFSLPATRLLVERLGRVYDLVLIDGPPLLQVAYATTLARYVDRIVVVVQHGSRVDRMEDMAQRLELIGTPLAGYIYNAAPLRYEMMASEGSLQDVLGGRSPDSTSSPGEA